MVALTLPQTVRNVLIVGPINNKLDKLDAIEKLLPEFDWVVINGILSLDDYILSIDEQTLNRLDQLISTKKVVCNMSAPDLLVANRDSSDTEQWIRSKPNVVLINFGGSFQCIVVHGGIPSHITSLDQLEDNLEVSFAPHPHETYSGGLGYVIANTPVTKWAPKFYRYSAQLGNSVEGQVYAFKIDRNGIRRTILL